MGFYIGTVGQNVTESVIQQYVKKQGRQKEYRTVRCNNSNCSSQMPVRLRRVVHFAERISERFQSSWAENILLKAI